MKTVRIAIDGYNLAMAKGTGVATYGFGLANGIQALGHEAEALFGIDVGNKPQMRETLFFDRIGRERRETRRQARRRAVRETLLSLVRRPISEVQMTDEVEKQAYVHQLPEFDKVWSSPNLFDIANRHFRLFGSFLTLRMKDAPDIMHWTYPVPIRMAGARNIYTLHDLVPLKLPYTTLDYKKSYHKLIDKCVRSADHICTVSQSSLDDIVSRFPDAAKKITNTYQSTTIQPGDVAIDPAVDARIIEGIFGLQHREYFLYVGAIDPKKNIARLLEAYLGMQSNIPLVIVGGRDWGTESQIQGNSVNLYGFALNDRIIKLDYLPRPLLMQLVRGARALMFPSLYEGFGLPVLEAMSLGTPVVTSKVSSLPEIVGDAGLLIDPYDVRSIAEAMTLLEQKPDLVADLSARGAARAEEFSRAKYHERLSAMYDRILGSAAS